MHQGSALHGKKENCFLNFDNSLTTSYAGDAHSPVMDLLNKSGASSPTVGLDGRSPNADRMNRQNR
jgi:hypothetical protein